MDFELITLHNSDLAQRTAQACSKQLHLAQLRCFSDSELAVTLPTNVSFSGKKVYVIHATSAPVHERIMQALLLAHELCNAQAAEIVGVLPYFAYTRQDKSTILNGRPPVAAIIKALESAGYTSFITVDLHAPNIEVPLFSVPMQNINPATLLANHIQERHKMRDFCVVAPDAGAVKLVSEVAAILNVPTLFFNKKRIDSILAFRTDQSAQEYKKAIVIDDIIDSGATAIGVCTQLKKMGFESIEGYFVHPILSGNAIKNIETSHYDVIHVSNAIDLPVTSAKINTFDISAVIERALHAK